MKTHWIGDDKNTQLSLAYPDNDLVISFQKGDEASLDLLMSRWFPKIQRFISKRVGNNDDVDEIVQDTILKIIKALRNGVDVDDFDRWAFTVARSATASYFRKTKDIPTEDLEVVMLSRTGLSSGTSRDPIVRKNNNNDPAVIAEANEMNALIHVALESLEKSDPRKARVIKRRYIDFQKEQDIADEMGIPLGTVKRLMNHAKVEIRIFLDTQSLV